VTLFESISVNGMIARPDDDAGFFTNINWTAWIDLTREAGGMVWGRRTHDMYRGAAVPELEGIQGFVLTRDPGYATEAGWRVAASPEEVIELAGKSGVKGLVVAGGSSVNGAFAEAGLLDRVVLDVESIAVGEGIPLFPPGKFDLHLTLRDVRRLTPTVVQLHYDVRRPGATGPSHER
jgi:dihydrofolate reductase